MLGTGVDEVAGVLYILQGLDEATCPGQDTTGYRSRVTLVSTRSLKILNVVAIDTSSPGGGNRTGLLQVDSARHELMVGLSTSGQNSQDDFAVYSLADLQSSRSVVKPVADIVIPSTPAKLIAAGGDVSGLVSADNLTGIAGDTDLQLEGAYLDPGANRLYVLLVNSYGGTASPTSAHGPGAEDIYVTAIDVATNKSVWTQFLGACQYSATVLSNGFTSNLWDPILFRNSGQSQEVVVGCMVSKTPSYVTDPSAQGGGNGASFQFEGGSMLSYAIPLGVGGIPVQNGIRHFTGRSHTYSAAVAPDLGRLFWVATPATTSEGASAPAPTAVTFDSDSGVYLAAPTVGKPAATSDGLAMGYARGRLYSVGFGGITVVDARGTPPEEGVFYPTRDCSATHLAIDSNTRHVFVQYVADCAKPAFAQTTAEPQFTVYADETPDITMTAAAPPDTYTQQVAEKPGVTSTQYNAQTQATGSRIRLVGGPAGFLRAMTFGGYTYQESTFQQAFQKANQTPPDDVTREISTASVSHGNLDNYQSSASATVVSMDDSSTNQLADPSQRTKDARRARQDDCSDPTVRGGHRVSYAADSFVLVSCDIIKRDTHATAQAGPYSLALLGTGIAPGVALPISVGSSWADTHTYIDDNLGLVADSNAIAKGIELGVVRFNSVEASSHCYAHGRDNTAGCDYTRVINGASLASGTPLANGSCMDEVTPRSTVNTCTAMLAQLNTLQPGYLTFSMPSPDARSGYINGSPGGYQAVAQRELYEHLQDRILNYDDSQQIPGLEVLYVNDSFTSPSRLDLQLANVQSESRYGILAGDQGSFDSGGSVTETGGSGPAVVDTTGLPTPILTTVTKSPPTPTTRFTPLATLVQRLLDGLGLLRRSPAGALLIAPLMTLLFAPLLVAWRRRVLLVALSQS